ncbi:MAG: hypothetical protein OEQ18_06520 [Gammaproteobacteria bacterium]|nr:hypothetical protein [Gammaproteobacteria bacterium]
MSLLDTPADGAWKADELIMDERFVAFYIRDAILKNRQDKISARMSDIIVGLYEDWLWLNERIESTTNEIELISKGEANCQRLMSVPGIGPKISTATTFRREHQT